MIAGCTASISPMCAVMVEGEGCDIYDKRPLSCLEYSGSSDPLVKDVCLIKEV
jgi:Fe-S-cluster containining protein